jgi:phytoene synthase
VALAPAEACGIAFQLTNILRDVKEDARLGRIYLPLEDLKRFGVSEDDIMNANATPQFLELMKFEAARAREFYDKARPLLQMINADSRGALAVMIGIYGGILRKIEERNFAVFEGRIRLSSAEKLRIVLKNWGRKS